MVKSFPDIKDSSVLIAAFGSSTHAELKEYGLKLSIAAPTQNAPSMAMAIENCILGKERGPVVATKSNTVRRTPVRASAASNSKRGKAVIANKEVYKQRMEAKKAQAAARKAAREALKAEAVAKAAAEAGDKK